GRPTEGAILTSRLVDRPLRPLFPKGYRNDVQIIITSLSADRENPLDIPAIIGASTALMISDIPFLGPVAGIRVGRIGDEWVFNPTTEQQEQSSLDLRLAGTEDAILMIEANAGEMDEAMMLAAIKAGHQAMQPVIQIQKRMVADLGKPKREYRVFEVSAATRQRVAERLDTRLAQVFADTETKEERNEAIDLIRDELVVDLDDSGERKETLAVFDEALKRQVRERILAGVRPDGRGPKDVRPIWSEVGLSPRAHGSGLFTRGETQVLSLVTLGTPREEQTLDGLGADETKRYMHHYNFPPFSTGETWPMRGPKRREIGHGALAEGALRAVIPPEADFPYTIRVVSEVLSSNGSTSMASVCGSTLGLLDAGVPIKAMVAGVAMGLVMDPETGRYQILTDIMGMEDHLGDMDFKVAGSDKGITALQLDIKIKGLTYEILEQGLAQALEGRLHILGKMRETISEPREDLSPFAPRITTLHINPEKIGALIGPSGKNIRSIIEETGAQIDVEDDGTVFVASADGESARKAIERIRAQVEDPEIGKIYTGKVVRITDFGAFVEILPKKDGMVHISQLAPTRVNKVEDVVKLGDEIMVMVIDVDPQGKVRLSRTAVLEGLTSEEARERDQRNRRPSGGGGDRGPRGDRGGGDRGGERRGFGGGERRGFSGER
ncbi:MAG: polyribonucleotide nucleotidyltransferase, partial [Anaerolineae bacterium]|nr:polyribonucleotide nucleotidyltransferase [Anaerolineae bacterium]